MSFFNPKDRRVPKGWGHPDSWPDEDWIEYKTYGKLTYTWRDRVHSFLTWLRGS